MNKKAWKRQSRMPAWKIFFICSLSFVEMDFPEFLFVSKSADSGAFHSIPICILPEFPLFGKSISPLFSSFSSNFSFSFRFPFIDRRKNDSSGKCVPVSPRQTQSSQKDTKRKHEKLEKIRNTPKCDQKYFKSFVFFRVFS